MRSRVCIESHKREKEREKKKDLGGGEERGKKRGKEIGDKKGSDSPERRIRTGIVYDLSKSGQVRGCDKSVNGLVTFSSP